MGKLKFHKMWEASASYAVFGVDHGSILPIVSTLKKVAGHTDKYWMYYCDGRIGGAYYEEKEMEKAAEQGAKNFLDNSFRKKYFNRIEEILNAIAAYGQKFESLDIESFDQRRLLNLFKKAIGLESDVFGHYLACQPQCISKIENETQGAIAKLVPKENIAEVYTLLSTSIKITTLKKEEIDWLKLIIKVKKKNNISSDEIGEMLDRHYRKYYLLNAADGHAPWSQKHFRDKFKQDIKKSIDQLEKNLGSLHDLRKNVISGQEKIVKQYNIDSAVLRFCQILAEIGHVRLEMRLRGWMPLHHYLNILVIEIARRFSCGGDLIKQMRVSEIINLFDGKKFNVSELEERRKSFLFFINNKNVKLFANKEAQDHFKIYFNEIDYTQIKELKGNTAYRGKVVGYVLVVTWADDVSKKIKYIKNDTILVAGQTRPHLMPIISKSKAIVTDEGGITSHAAIVSRELRIPCVIATKIATRVLKDGDLVEVDANTGTVKIIQRK